MDNCLFDTYKNSIMPHGTHMFQTASYMVMEKMCAYPSSNYSLPYLTFVLHFFVECPRIDLPSP